MFLNGKKWFYYLRVTQRKPNEESLEKVYGLEVLKNKLIICYQIKYRFYTYFDSVSQFVKYKSTINPQKNHFYEVITLRKQKPHFDVDINTKDNKNIDHGKILEDLLRSIQFTLKKEKIITDPIKDILVFESHGPNKKSYHVIIDNYYHVNNIEAGCFYQEVIDNMSPLFSVYVDSAVYKISQQFRLLGSRKEGTDRVKKYINRDDYIPEDLFKSSLVSYTRGCEQLPSFDYSEEDLNFSDEKKIDLGSDRSLVEKSMTLLGSKIGLSPTDSKFPFTFQGIKENLILLNRIYPSSCKVCFRIHYNENPYLFVCNNGVLLFNCRRSEDNKFLKLGRVFEVEEVKRDFSEYTEIIERFNKENLTSKSDSDQFEGIESVESTKTEIIEEKKKIVIENLKVNKKLVNNIKKKEKETKKVETIEKIEPPDESNEDFLDSLIELSNKTLRKIKINKVSNK